MSILRIEPQISNTSANFTFGNTVTANYFVGNGSLLTGIVASGVSTSTAITVTANEQPNITSVGTLTSLDISGNITGDILPSANLTFDIGSSTQRWKDLYLSNSTIYLGETPFSSANVFPFNLTIAPEVLAIQVAAPDAGDNTRWLWTWETSTLPYARSAITNSPQISVPMYKQGSYQVNNFANEQTGNMTQTHHMYFKWIDGAGTENVISWAAEAGNVSFSNSNINGGANTMVQRINVSVPASITIPTLVTPNVEYHVSGINANAFNVSNPHGPGGMHVIDVENNNRTVGPIYEGGTYTFMLEDMNGEKFYLTEDNGTFFTANGFFGEYTTGVTGSRNDGTTGKTTLVFTVPVGAPSTLYYQSATNSLRRGVIIVKPLQVETNINGNYVVYAQHTGEGHKTPIEIRPIPSLVNQMCVVYDASVGKFVPQDLATYVENTPSFKNKIREVAGTATLVAGDGVVVVPSVTIVEDPSYLPLVGNKVGDISYSSDSDTIYLWNGTEWRNTKSATITSLPGASITGQVANALVAGTVYTAAQPNITSVGTLTGLVSTGIINLDSTSNVSLGAVANVHITGGTTGQYLQTDGSGTLSWSTVTGGGGGTVANRVVVIADATSVTINGDTTDMATQTNTQAVGTLTINAITGTPVNGQKIMFRLQSTNIQTFSWNVIFAGSTDLSLPTASTGGTKYDYIGFIYNSTAAKWHAVSRNFGF